LYEILAVPLFSSVFSTKISIYVIIVQPSSEMHRGESKIPAMDHNAPIAKKDRETNPYFEESTIWHKI
jgi:hypothetical protein